VPEMATVRIVWGAGNLPEHLV